MIFLRGIFSNKGSAYIPRSAADHAGGSQMHVCVFGVNKSKFSSKYFDYNNVVVLPLL